MRQKDQRSGKGSTKKQLNIACNFQTDRKFQTTMVKGKSHSTRQGEKPLKFSRQREKRTPNCLMTNCIQNITKRGRRIVCEIRSGKMLLQSSPPGSEGGVKYVAPGI